jgi:hypothetical protein
MVCCARRPLMSCNAVVHKAVEKEKKQLLGNAYLRVLVPHKSDGTTQ